MSRLRVGFLAFCLVLMLSAASVSVAFAAPPPSGSCTVVVTYDWSAVGSEYPSGNLRSQSAIQDTKSTDGTYCYSRAVTKYWTTSGTVSIHLRETALFNGSSFFGELDSSTTLTVGTSAQFHYGAWVDPCTNFLASSYVFSTVSGYYVHSQTYPYEYRC